jgi:nickel transport protein
MNRCLLSVLILLLTGSAAFGHGVTCRNIDEPAVAVLFAYSDGEPMSYAETKVFGPQSSSDLEFQNGRTDARGIFGFIPDRPGNWRIEARDGMGHKAIHEIAVKDTTATLQKPATPSTREPHLSSPGALQILLGLSIIANLALLLARKR